MTQTAQVKKLLSGEEAEVSVRRKSACGHDCSECSGGCELGVTGPDVTVTAENPLGARQGDTVLVESSSGGILSAAAVVYLMPFVCFFAGYGISRLFAPGGGISMLCAFLGFLCGLLPARAMDRRAERERSLHFRIVEILASCSDI